MYRLYLNPDLNKPTAKKKKDFLDNQKISVDIKKLLILLGKEMILW